jgi:hypothetical protein
MYETAIKLVYTRNGVIIENPRLIGYAIKVKVLKARLYKSFIQMFHFPFGML